MSDQLHVFELAGTIPLLLGSDENLTHGDVGRKAKFCVTHCVPAVPHE